MSKKPTARTLKPTEAKAKVINLRISPQKLNLVAASIRGLKVQRALNELDFSAKRIAADVRKALYSAISNAENNHNLDIDSLVVADHVLGDEDGNVFLAVVDAEGEADELRHDGGPARPGLDHVLAARAVRGFGLLQEIAVDKRTFPNRTGHR